MPFRWSHSQHRTRGGDDTLAEMHSGTTRPVSGGLGPLLTLRALTVVNDNVLRWLWRDDPAPGVPEVPASDGDVALDVHELSRVEAQGTGEGTIASVERVLRKAGVLKALSRAKWMP